MIIKLTCIVIIQLLLLYVNVIAWRHYKERRRIYNDRYDRHASSLEEPRSRHWRPHYRANAWRSHRSRWNDDGYDGFANSLETSRSRDWNPSNKYSFRGRRYEYDHDNGFRRKWDSRESHKMKGGWKKRSYRSNNEHRLALSAIMMPSGKMKKISIPDDSSHWNCGKKPKLIYLSPKGKRGKIEYNIVKDEMEKTWGAAFPYQIVKIQKVQNSCLWKRYQYRKKQILAETTAANERMLFHGSTTPTPYALTYKGFDERLTSMSSGSWGAGFYFAENSSKSHTYTAAETDGSRKMLLCRVILGNMQTFNAQTVLAHPPVGYHSIKGNVGQTEYIVYRGEQVYPEFLITYK